MTKQRLFSLVVGTVTILAAGWAAAQTPPPPPPAYGAPITLEQAKKITAGAEAKKNNWSMVITILDSAGHVVMVTRMDGALLGSIDVARDKAWSAVAFRRPTKVFEDLVSQGG